MTVPLQEARDSLLERAAAYVRSRLHGAGAQAAEALVRVYWERVAAQDLVGRDPVDLAGAALAHLHLAERRLPGTARVRVYTPAFDDHGWASTHSVVEVVVDDMPFLLDSLSMELVRQGCGLHLVVHPVVAVSRDADGHLLGIGAGPGGGGVSPGIWEAFVHLEIDRQPPGERLEALRADLLAVLDDVRAAVEDWPAMRAQAAGLAAELQERPPPGDAQDAAEARDFLRFLADDHFVFLGFRDYDLVHDSAGPGGPGCPPESPGARGCPPESPGARGCPPEGMCSGRSPGRASGSCATTPTATRPPRPAASPGSRPSCATRHRPACRSS